ncbi:hypothetical protein [Rhizobium sp. BK251]|uniref:hypothetical protein n=1 Tax=Rhizobium sp. BK251 TaxID=2512125 RepID=UPI001042C676|nr:hypothetical protein [Rhizobium sp. BK251]TCL73717.1 hypothetical protein EV286_103249 [Rhizobium sp. BK251]
MGTVVPLPDDEIRLRYADGRLAYLAAAFLASTVIAISAAQSMGWVAGGLALIACLAPTLWLARHAAASPTELIISPKGIICSSHASAPVPWTWIERSFIGGKYSQEVLITFRDDLNGQARASLEKIQSGAYNGGYLRITTWGLREEVSGRRVSSTSLLELVHDYRARFGIPVTAEAEDGAAIFTSASWTGLEDG